MRRLWPHRRAVFGGGKDRGTIERFAHVALVNGEGSGECLRGGCRARQQRSACNVRRSMRATWCVIRGTLYVL